ncbi:MAG: proline--tRNA ligase, partial [Pedobacter sp.]
MAHSDDAGLVLPPRLAPIQVVIVPIYKGQEDLQKISSFVDEFIPKLKRLGISVKYDDRDTQRPGFKFAEYELKGVPVRLAIGGRDMENGTVELARRDTREKQTVQQEGLDIYIAQLLEDIQQNIFKKALDFRTEHITAANSYDEFKQLLDGKAGFISTHWDGTPETEQKIKEETKATIRCVPLNNTLEDGVCIYSGKPSTQRVLFARAY